MRRNFFVISPLLTALLVGMMAIPALALAAPITLLPHVTATGDLQAGYGLQLQSQPTALVVVDVQSPNGAHVTPTQLRFTDKTWNQQQQVMVNAPAGSMGALTIHHSVTSADPFYAALSVEDVHINLSQRPDAAPPAHPATDPLPSTLPSTLDPALDPTQQPLAEVGPSLSPDASILKALDPAVAILQLPDVNKTQVGQVRIAWSIEDIPVKATCRLDLMPLECTTPLLVPASLPGKHVLTISAPGRADVRVEWLQADPVSLTDELGGVHLSSDLWVINGVVGQAVSFALGPQSAGLLEVVPALPPAAAGEASARPPPEPPPLLFGSQDQTAVVHWADENSEAWISLSILPVPAVSTQPAVAVIT